MDRDTGAGILLSFLLVGIVAVAFYRPDRPPSMVVGRPPASSSTKEPPRPTPGVPLAEATTTRGPSDGGAARPKAADGPGIVRRTSAAGPRRGGALRRPGSSFTKAEGGETLADVARRVYGTEEAAGPLWRANRDQLDGPEAALRPGMILRTP